MDQWGREFLVTFVANFDQTGHLTLYVTARSTPATVFVENPLYSVSQTFTVGTQSSMSLQLTAQLQYTSENVVDDKVSAVWMRCAK